MENVRLIIARFMTLGIALSFIMIVLGGILYLMQHGMDVVQYHEFHAEPIRLNSLFNIVSKALELEPRSLMQLGLLTLFFMQIMRVALTAWYFAREKSFLFFNMSLFILLILITTVLLGH